MNDCILVAMGKVQHLMKAAKRYRELQAETRARREAEKHAESHNQTPPDGPSASRADVDDKNDEAAS